MELPPYHSPSVCFIKQEDPELPTFNYDEVINPISAYKGEATKGLSENYVVTDEDLDEFVLPEEI